MKAKVHFVVVRSCNRSRNQVEVVRLDPSLVEDLHGPSCQAVVLLARGRSPVVVVVHILHVRLAVVHMHLSRLSEVHIHVEEVRNRLCLWGSHSMAAMGLTQESLVILDALNLQLPLLPPQHLVGSGCHTGLYSAVWACRSGSRISVCHPLALAVPLDPVRRVSVRHWCSQT